MSISLFAPSSRYARYYSALIASPRFNVINAKQRMRMSQNVPRSPFQPLSAPLLSRSPPKSKKRFANPNI